MKKVIAFLILAVCLTGCDAATMMETVLDAADVPVMAQSKDVRVDLPDEAALQSMGSEDAEMIYFCEGYTVTVQTLDGGDLERTFRQTTGFSQDQLTIMETKQNEVKRYDCVWAAAGEGGDQVARCVVLDDGSYHYVVTVMGAFSDAGDLTKTWQNILASVKLVSTG